MILFNKNEIANIDQAVIQGAVEKAYRLMLEEDFNMPDRMHVSDGENMLLLMPCFSRDYFATKLVSVFPGAPQGGMPVVNGVVVLNDNATGQPLAMMDGASLTAQRTGAVGGLAVNLLAPDSIETAGVLGAGVQGYQQARYLLFNRPVKTLFLCDLNPEAARAMGRQLTAEFPSVSVEICDTAKALVDSSRVVIAATTSTSPVFEADSETVRGKLFISIGSFRPDMKEFPDAVIETADQVYADTLFACKESGDIAIPLRENRVDEKKIAPFAQLLASGRPDPEQTLFFKSVGMALFDLATAIAVYTLSKSENLGQQFDL